MQWTPTWSPVPAFCSPIARSRADIDLICVDATRQGVQKQATNQGIRGPQLKSFSCQYSYPTPHTTPQIRPCIMRHCTPLAAHLFGCVIQAVCAQAAGHGVLHSWHVVGQDLVVEVLVLGRLGGQLHLGSRTLQHERESVRLVRSKWRKPGRTLAGVLVIGRLWGQLLLGSNTLRSRQKECAAQIEAGENTGTVSFALTRGGEGGGHHRPHVYARRTCSSNQIIGSWGEQTRCAMCARRGGITGCVFPSVL
eukprot:scaffold157516_cov18-Tisochrysis_lutea.AAC.2